MIPLPWSVLRFTYLVDNNYRLDTLAKGLTKHSLGLDAHALDGVDDDKRTIGDTESSSDFGREVNVTRRVDEIDQKVLAVGFLADNVLDVLGIGETVVKSDGSGLDGDTTLLLVWAIVRCSRFSSLRGGDDTGFGKKRVGQGRLAVIDVGNDGHVTDIGGLVHKRPDLFNGEAIIMVFSGQRIDHNGEVLISDDPGKTFND